MNTRGMIVYENPQFSLLDYYSYEFEELRLFLFSLELDNGQKQIEIPGKFKIEDKIETIIEKDDNGLYIIFVDKKQSDEDLSNIIQIQTWLMKRIQCVLDYNVLPH
jgi:hypothetical protein